MTDALFEEWRAYEKLVENDYMSHARFFRRVEDEVKAHCGKPISILDLGCGDASPIRDMLKRLDVERYCGVDKSVTVLAKAEHNLALLDIPYGLYAGDALDVLQSLPAQYDLIVASYTFHHMGARETKERVLRECRRVLSPDGLVVVIDVFLREGESREAYLHRWEGNARSAFTELNAEEMTTLIDHIWSCDFPESFSTYEELGSRAGYDRVVSLAEDGLNRLVVLETSTS